MNSMNYLALAVCAALTGCVGNISFSPCPDGALCAGDISFVDLALPEEQDLASGNSNLDGTIGTSDLFDISSPDLPDMTILPSTCAEVKAVNPNAVDGAHTIYFQRNPGKPWTVHCVDLAGKPKEYLSLPMAGPNANFGQYTAGGQAPGSNVRTNYREVRLDPVSLLVDVADETFASSAGQLTNSGGPVVTSVAFGAALDCAPQGFGVPTGLANVDLRGTPFVVKQNAFSKGPSASGQWCGAATYGNGDQVVSVIGGAFCGGIAGGPWPGQFPFPFNRTPGFTLALDYK